MAPMWHHYRLLTRWLVAAPPPPVWDAVLQSRRWPDWWPGLERVRELEPGSDGGVGNLREYDWRTPFGWPLRVRLRATRIERLRLLEGRASGDVRGWGRWYFQPGAGTTGVVYEWDVELTRRPMRMLSTIAHPLFARSHQRLMRTGARGLGAALGCRVTCEALPAGARPAAAPDAR